MMAQRKLRVRKQSKERRKYADDRGYAESRARKALEKLREKEGLERGL